MIKSELNRIFKSRKSIITLFIIAIMPIIDFFMHIYGEILVYGGYNPTFIFHPVYSSFLSGSSIGSFTQILFFWLLPLYFLIIYSDSASIDLKNKYSIPLITRIGKQEYYKTKFKIAFLFPFISVFAILTLNLLLNILIFHSGTSFAGLEGYYNTFDNWSSFGFTHPYIYYLIYIITNSFICAGCSIMGLCCSILFKNLYIAYPATFFIWFIQIIIPFGIGNTIQPYTEYGFTYFVSGLFIFILILFVVCAITYFSKVKKDEIY